MSKKTIWNCDACGAVIDEIYNSEPIHRISELVATSAFDYLRFSLEWENDLCFGCCTRYMEDFIAMLLKQEYKIDYKAMKLRCKIEE